MYKLACTICSIIITAGTVAAENEYFPGKYTYIYISENAFHTVCDSHCCSTKQIYVRIMEYIGEMEGSIPDAIRIIFLI